MLAAPPYKKEGSASKTSAKVGVIITECIKMTFFYILSSLAWILPNENKEVQRTLHKIYSWIIFAFSFNIKKNRGHPNRKMFLRFTLENSHSVYLEMKCFGKYNRNIELFLSAKIYEVIVQHVKLWTRFCNYYSQEQSLLMCVIPCISMRLFIQVKTNSLGKDCRRLGNAALRWEPGFVNFCPSDRLHVKIFSFPNISGFMFY